MSWFIALDRQIPTLSPSQEKWLRTEYHEEIAAAGNRFTPRALAAMDSIEFQIHIAKPRNGELIGALTQIANGTARDRSHEVALWASVSDWLIDYQYWQAVNALVIRGTVQKNIGHVDSLYKSAELGSKLIVGLNSDASVASLKGQNRPILNHESRAVVLAAFAFVDAVVLFEEETPSELIALIIPDVLVKGKQYEIHEIAGHDTVLANGGRVETLELVPGISTSVIIEKIKNLE